MPTGIYKRTEEYKRKISEKMKGRKNPHKGHKHSEETKRKISESLTGKKLSEKHKKKIIKSLKKQWADGLRKSGRIGKKNSEEWKQKTRERMMGNKYGSHKLSEEHKRKIGEGNKGKIGFWKNKKFFKETRKKMSESHKLRVLEGRHNNYKGGITLLNEQIRKCFQSRQWRSDVFTKDNFICQNCGVRGVYLESHHIKEFSKIIEEYQIKTLEQALNCEELWNINNGMTLCKKCHNKTKNGRIMINK